MCDLICLRDGSPIPAQVAFHLNNEEDREVNFQVHPDRLEQKSYEIKAVASSGGRDYSDGYQTVGYPGLRPYNYYRPATYRARGVDVRVAPGLNLGYVMGRATTFHKRWKTSAFTPIC